MKTPSRRRGTLAAIDIARLAHGHLGARAELSYYPDIPPERRIGARLVYARHLRMDEPLLVVYDSTLLGTATSGFVATPERFCWKRPWSAPGQIEWERLRPTLVSAVKGRIMVAGEEVPTDALLAGNLGRFLEEMASRPDGWETTPYRVAGRVEESATPVDTITRSTWEKLGAMHGLEYRPFIPRYRLAQGRAAVGMPPAEEVAVLYEDRFHSTPRGFLLTAQRLAWHRGDGTSASVAWRDLVHVQVRSTSVVVGGERLPWTLLMDARGDLPHAMGQLFESLGEKARAGALG